MRSARFFLIVPRLWVLLALLTLVPCAQAVTEHWQADFIAVTDTAPPPADAAGWHAVSLPFYLQSEHRRSDGGWFRVRVNATEMPQSPQAMYLWWLNLNAVFYFNGERVGGSGRMTPPITRNWNRPFLVELPRALWRQGENVLLIRLASEPGWGVLSPLEIGATAVLMPEFERRTFLQVELTRSLTIVTVLRRC